MSPVVRKGISRSPSLPLSISVAWIRTDSHEEQYPSTSLRPTAARICAVPLYPLTTLILPPTKSRRISGVSRVRVPADPKLTGFGAFRIPLRSVTPVRDITMHVGVALPALPSQPNLALSNRMPFSPSTCFITSPLLVAPITEPSRLATL